MDLKGLTLDELKAGRPDLSAALTSEGVASERKRGLAILKKADEFGYREDGVKHLESGASETEALSALKDRKIADLEKVTPTAPGPNADPEKPKAAGLGAEGDLDEEALKTEFGKSAALKAEFPTVDHYLAYKRAEGAGRVRINKKG
jgi:hypothetical protein